MDNREINGSFNNSELNEVNIQSDLFQKYNLTEEDFANVESDINGSDIDVEIKEKNKLFLENLKTSLKENDKKEAKKILGWIRNSIGATASILTIESAL